MASRVLARNVQLYTANVSSSSRRSLVVFFPWLLAREGAVQKFVALYHRMGLDVVVAHGQAKHFLVPRLGMEFVAELHQCLANRCNWLDGRGVFLHGTSVGAYLLTLFQMHLAATDDGDPFRGHLRGQVMDSIVYGGVDRMVAGLADNLVPVQRLRPAARALVNAYFGAFHSSTMQFYERSMQFYQTKLAASPVLFVYSDNDALCDAALLRSNLLPAMRASGHAVSSVSWPESIHAAHYYSHPKEYVAALESFIGDCNRRAVEAQAKQQQQEEQQRKQQSDRLLAKL